MGHASLTGEIKFILVEGLVCWIADLGIWELTENFEMTKPPLEMQKRMRAWRNSALPFWSFVLLLCHTGRLCGMEKQLWKVEGSPLNSTFCTWGMIMLRIIHCFFQTSENVRYFFYFVDVCIVSPSWQFYTNAKIYNFFKKYALQLYFYFIKYFSLSFVNSWWNLRNSNEERSSERRCPLDQREEEMPPVTRMTSAKQKQMWLGKDTSKLGPRCGSPLCWSSTWSLWRIAWEVPKGEIVIILLILGSQWGWGQVTSSISRAICRLLWSNLLQKITAFDF